MQKKITTLYFNFMNDVKECHVSAYAASAAFFMFLSLIPMLMLICAITPYTPLTKAYLMETMAQVLPATLVPLAIKTVMEVYDKSPAIISVTVIVTMWSAGKGMLAVIRGLNSIHEINTSKNYFMQRIKASIYTVILVVLIILTLVLGVFGDVILEGLQRHIIAMEIIGPILSNIKILIILGVLIIFFIALFTYTPSMKLNWRTQVVGAIFVSVGWSAFSYLFSIYVNNYAGNSIYGNMTTVAMIMMWLYSCFYILFLGALLSKFLAPATEYLIMKASEKQLDRP